MAHKEMSADLKHWMSLGFGKEIDSFIVGDHTSKSIGLPIVGGSLPDSNVEVTWFANNFHFYFLGVSMRYSVLSTLLYPISNLFGRCALSGHVNKKVAPDVTNFKQAYQNQYRLRRFGGDCGDGFGAALVIRYLHEISKIDPEKILDICLRKTSYGLVDNIDGNAVSFEDLAKLLGFDTDKFFYYDFDIKTIPTDIFERINIDWFGTGVKKASVHITMAKGLRLPALSPFPAEVYVDPQDTRLAEYLPADLQKRKVKGEYHQDYLLEKIPVEVLNSRRITPEEYREIQSSPYPVSYLYSRVNMETREFTFTTPNVLDCALTAFFFLKVVAPLLREEMRTNS